MAAILTIFASFFRSAISISAFAHELGNVLEISVYLKDNADANVSKNRIKEFEHVESVALVPKATSWANLKREMDLPDIEIPLPDTLHVKVDKPENIDTVFKNIKQLNSVEDMSYAQDLAKKIEALNHVVNVITLLVVIVMAMLTITIINNTIQQMCEGELIQKAQENNIPTIEDYIQKTYLKTGTLFEGTIKGVLEISTIKNSKLIDFAKNIGILFQINNDIKNLEKDITNGIYTLPIIFSNSINISKNSIEKTLSLIDNYTSNAIQALSCLGESEYKKSLIGVVECLKISEINITNLEKNTQI